MGRKKTYLTIQEQTKARTATVNRYKAAHYHRIPFDVPNELFLQIKEYAAGNNMAVNEMIRTAVLQMMEGGNLTHELQK